jgi:hypothetical protein
MHLSNGSEDVTGAGILAEHRTSKGNPWGELQRFADDYSVRTESRGQQSYIDMIHDDDSSRL